MVARQRPDQMFYASYIKATLQVAARAVQECYAKYDFRGKTNSTNRSGDNQESLDIAADKAVEAVLRKNPIIAGFCSEERDGFVQTCPTGRYIVMYDPLDGSQNIGVGISVGCIFGVHRGNKLEDLRDGRKMVAAAYAVHSATLLFTFAWAHRGVYQRPCMERFDFTDQRWVMVRKNIEIPQKGKTYCINDGNGRKWDRITKRFVSKLKREGRSVRWSACMVLDVHRPLLQGGMFSYPIDSKHTKGRLRLVYENYSMAFLWEAAGGKAIASVNSRRKTYKHILDTPFPTNNIHARGGVMLLGPHEFEVFDKVLKTTPPPFATMSIDSDAEDFSESEFEGFTQRRVLPPLDFTPIPLFPKAKM